MSYTQPKAWTLTSEAGVSVFTAPENNLQIAVIEVVKATGALAPIADLSYDYQDLHFVPAASAKP